MTSSSSFAGFDGKAERLVADALKNADDGELYVEHSQSESLVFDDNRLRSASYDEGSGFGLRAVKGETAAYAHSSVIDGDALKRAAATCGAILDGNRDGKVDLSPAASKTKLYGASNPVEAMGFAAKINLLEEVNAFARKLDPRVKQVSVSIGNSWQKVGILRGDGSAYHDTRPLTRFGVSVTTEDNRTSGNGSYGFGGRAEPLTYLTEQAWKDAAREAVRQALVGLEAEAAPAGEMDVLLGPGWPGILLHEAIGHGLEGDFNRKGTSAFAGLMGQMIASDEVTVVDDGTLPDRRGSISIDDEGTAPNCTTLIERGRLVGYMQDRLNARLTGTRPTGNGRRESYAHAPLPRMTNTYMLNGRHHPDEIRASIKRGLYAKSFGGGQVDITSGKFVFTCTEAYLIEDGKIGKPVKGAILIGAGAEALKRISMVGNDMALDPGIGTCGKAGQGVPVGVGQPTLRINNLTVGGTKGMNQPTAARFLQGSIMRHVVTMTLTGAVGLMVLFVVDLADLYFLNLLDKTAITAGVGFGGTLVFANLSLSLGCGIATSALVARSVGAGNMARARQLGVNGLLFSLLVGTTFTLLIDLFIDQILAFLGATGEAAHQAKLFVLTISPGLICVAGTITTSSTLRAIGDFNRAMWNTMTAGLVTLALDPLFIFVFGWGIQGAATANVLAYICAFTQGLYSLFYRNNFLTAPTLQGFRADFPAIFKMALPLVVAQLATPFAAGYMNYALSPYGTDVVAAGTVVNRLVPVAFGVVFSLANSMGPIIGQNFGAKNFVRVRMALNNGLTFALLYCAAVSLLLFLLRHPLMAAFHVAGRAAELVDFYCTWIAMSWILMSALFVCNAVFNNLGKPIYSTFTNWGRATIGTIPFVAIGAKIAGAEGVLVGSAVGAAAFGALAMALAFDLIKSSLYARINGK